MATNPTVTEANENVDTQIANANTRTSNAINDLASFVNSIVDLAGQNITVEDVNLGIVENLEPSAIAVDLPNKPNNKISDIKDRLAEEPPAEHDVDSVTANLVEVPVFGGTSPTITFPEAPEYIAPVPATKPNVSEVDPMPSKPSDDLPSEVSLSSITIPNAPAINQPSFDISLPDFDIDAPTNVFVYEEPTYSSTLKDAIRTKLESDIENGGTGLSATVETDIFDRAKEREEDLLEETKTRITDEWATRGFSLPSGVLTALHKDADTEYDNRRSQLSREISIEQARLEQTNVQNALKNGIELEGIEINFANQQAERVMRAAQLTIEFAIRIYQSKVESFNSKIRLYEAQFVAFANELQAEKLKLDRFLAELEKASLEDKIDNTKISKLNAEVGRYNTIISLYEAELGSRRIEVETEGLKIDFYRAQIEDYVAKVNEQNTEFNLYQANVNGELAKVELYKAELEAYRTEVEAAVASIEGESTRVSALTKIEDLKLDEYKARLDRYKVLKEVAIEELRSQVDIYEADINRYIAAIGQAKANEELKLSASAREEALELETAKASLEEARINAEIAIKNKQLNLEANRGIVQMYSNLASAAANTINAIVALEAKAESTEST